MKNLPYYFIGFATLFALLGMLYGMYMAGSEDHALAAAHAHNNLLGWVTMAIYGLYYRTMPGTVTRLTAVHFAVALIANLIFPIGIALAILGQTPLLAAIGGALELLAMLIFAFVVWRNRAALTV